MENMNLGSARRAFVALAVLFLVCAGLIVHASYGMGGMGPDQCQLSQTAFCDTFQTIVGGGRGGDLDPAKWSFAREQQNHNPSQGLVNNYSPVDAEFCTTHQTRLADNDSFICGEQFGESNHWMEALNDAGSYATNSARIVQPFDFAGRTGNLVFDVDNKSFGGDHTHWTEVWLTDQPVQIPHTDHPSTNIFPRNGVGLEFSAGEKGCGAGHNGLSFVHVFQNYQESQIGPLSGVCFSAQDDMANHFQVKISTSRLELWGSDAGGANFRLLAGFDVNLNFTRGYWSFEHAGYNAGKDGNPSQVTYHWHAIGFDGPVLPADRDYQVPDALDMRTLWPSNAEDGTINLGYVTPKSYTFQNVDTSNVAAAYVTYNVFYQSAAHRMTATVNGHAETFSEPYSGNTGYQWGYLVQPVPVSDLVTGANSFRLTDASACSGNDCPAVANVDLELVLNDGAPVDTTTMPAPTTVAPTTTVAPVTTTTAAPVTTTTVAPTTTTTQVTTTTTIPPDPSLVYACYRTSDGKVDATTIRIGRRPACALGWILITWRHL